MNNQSKALILTITAVALVCISYTVGLNVSTAHAKAAAAATQSAQRADKQSQSQRDYDSYRRGILDTVYQVCNESRLSATISEVQCAALQDADKAEFLCSQANSLPTNHCWIEDKE